jgi:4-cresol dehydrogenase (hydroxylating)
MDPNRDRCGLHWVCTALPFDGQHVRKHASIIEDLARTYRLEPNISYLNASQRMLKCFAVIAFDRDAEDEQQRALAYHDDMLKRLRQAGYPPIRLGVQSMETVIPSDESHIEMLRQLKELFDPNDVLSPGHYDFRDAWKKAPIQAHDAAEIAS